jgi:DNA invertase Pin-like site-specific DNA recombinase
MRQSQSSNSAAGQLGSGQQNKAGHMATRAAVWARVSSAEQDTTNQLGALRQWAQQRGFEIAKEYALEESAWNGKHRARLDEAMRDARAGNFNVLLVWALDRLSREGIEATLSTVRQFRERGVRVLSMQEAWTDGPPEMQDLLTSFFAWMAQQESNRRSERVKAGLARRRSEGKPVGRQPGSKDKRRRKRSGYMARWERARQ